jgi:flagella basal body P-ring formation protein FlgA
MKKTLLASGLDLRAATWTLPAELKVTSSESAVISEAELRAALEKYLAASDPYQSGSFELVSLNLGPLPSLGLGPGPVTFRFQPQASSSPVNVSGHFIYSRNNRDVGRSRVTALVNLRIPALVAARALPRGQVLAADDLSSALLPYHQARGALNDPDLAVGATLKTSLAAGAPLREQALGRSMVVRKGETVIINARQGQLNVTTTGEAKADGVVGDTIIVTNLSSKKNLRARIIGPGQVEVIF